MTVQEIKDKLKQIQDLFKVIAGEESAEPRDVEEDILTLGENAQEFFDLMEELEKDQIQVEFIQECLDTLINEYLKYISLPLEKSKDILTEILNLIYPCLHLLEENFNPAQADAIILLVINFFQKIDDVNTYGLEVLSQLATFLGIKFTKYIDVVWPYALKGWNKEETDMLMASLNLIQELPIACGKNFYTKLSILNQFFDKIEDKNFNSEIKCMLYSTVGDIFLNVGELTQPYLERALQVYKSGFLTIAELVSNPPDDIDELVVEKFRVNIIESFTCIHMAFQGNQSVTTILEALTTFFSITCSKNTNPTPFFLKQCLGVIADLITHHNEQAGYLQESEFTKSIISELQKESPDCSELIYYKNQIKTTFD